MSSPSRCLSRSGAGVVLGQHALERRVVALDGVHRVVDQRADGRAAAPSPGGAASAPPPAPRRRSRRCTRRGLRDEVSTGGIRDEVLVLGVGGRCLQVAVALLEGVGDVLQEDEPENDVLVLGGVQVAAHLVGGVPQDGLKWSAARCRDLRLLYHERPFIVFATGSLPSVQL